ncbi:hypothetical protein NIES3804_11340 [Microcystis aeruginosa NIES-3804]|uniref:Four helix bundle protein n=1 Tax=Microcystis aeruginosa NIES-3804 TaxID=2517783 RepID=A0A6H9G2C6_MICAE|nr:four helix bundle protein [Microcystis aeruginosa]GCL49578.1 hypothetical protein NIES3804_11340 [Microcystis aeruginosa NIES-3804]
MESKVYDKAYKFALRIVKGYKYLCETKQEYILSKQLLRSGTSIGANIAEANGAISQADFRAKMSIAYEGMSRNKVLAVSIERHELHRGKSLSKYQ